MSGQVVESVLAHEFQSEYFRECRERLFLYTDKLYEDMNARGLHALKGLHSGFYEGEGAVVATYLFLHGFGKRSRDGKERVGNPDIYLSYAKKHSKILLRVCRNDGRLDLVYGLSGAVIVLSRLYAITGQAVHRRAELRILKSIICKMKEREGGNIDFLLVFSCAYEVMCDPVGIIYGHHILKKLCVRAESWMIGFGGRKCIMGNTDYVRWADERQKLLFYLLLVRRMKMGGLLKTEMELMLRKILNSLHACPVAPDDPFRCLPAHDYRGRLFRKICGEYLTWKKRWNWEFDDQMRGAEMLYLLYDTVEPM